MATIKQIFGTNTSVTVTGLSTLANGATVASAEIDNSSDLNLAEKYDIELSGTGTDFVDIYIIKANATGVYPSTDVLANMTFIKSIDMSATTPKNHFTIEQLPKYYKTVYVNNSGAALTAATVNRMSANLTNA